MKRMTGAEVVITALRDSSVRFLIGIPGSHNLELYDRLAEEESLEPILVTNEQSAGFMADGIFRASGKMAALNLVPGPGLTHALSGIGECYMDQIPLLVLMCGTRKDTGKAYQLHDIDQAAILRPICKKVYQPKNHAEIYSAIRDACILARSAPHGPVGVEVPAQLYLTAGEATCDRFKRELHPLEFDGEQFANIVEALNNARSIAMYVGLGATGCDQLVCLAEKLDAIVYTTISAKGIYPENHPRWGWNTMGRACPPQLRSLETHFDCLLALGCRFAEVATGSYGFEPPPTLIHVDIDPSVFDRNYPSTFHLTSDAGVFLDALLSSRALKTHAPNTARLERLADAHEEIREDQHQKETKEDLITPADLFEKLQTIFGPETIYAADSGNGLFLAMENLRLPMPNSFLAPVDYSAMGYSVPAAIGAKLSCPERPVVALTGDGAFLMTGLELATAVERKLPIVVFLLRDYRLSQIAQFQEASFGRESCTELANYNALEIAAALGASGLAVKSRHALPYVVNEAFRLSQSGRPVVVEVPLDDSLFTHFSRGAVMTNFWRLSWRDRTRIVSRLLTRKLTVK